jgi:hypothetical protein
MKTLFGMHYYDKNGGRVDDCIAICSDGDTDDGVILSPPQFGRWLDVLSVSINVDAYTFFEYIQEPPERYRLRFEFDPFVSTHMMSFGCSSGFKNWERKGSLDQYFKKVKGLVDRDFHLESDK